MDMCISVACMQTENESIPQKFSGHTENVLNLNSLKPSNKQGQCYTFVKVEEKNYTGLRVKL